MRLTLDTSVFVDALRTERSRADLNEFLKDSLSFIWISSVVAAELEVGTRTTENREDLERNYLGVFERKDRIIPPTATQWRRAGRLLSEMERTMAPLGHLNDALVAVQAREAGWTVITRDRDFKALQRRLRGLKVVAPFPPPSKRRS